MSCEGSLRSTLTLFLRSLPETVKFNIIGFGSTIDPLFQKSVPYEKSNIQRADNHIANLQ